MYNINIEICQGYSFSSIKILLQKEIWLLFKKFIMFLYLLGLLKIVIVCEKQFELVTCILDYNMIILIWRERKHAKVYHLNLRNPSDIR